MCWVILKTNCTLKPKRWLGELVIATYRETPSPVTKPDNKWKSLILAKTPGVKLFVNNSVKPKFIEALIATILSNPSAVKCYRFLIHLKNNRFGLLMDNYQNVV